MKRAILPICALAAAYACAAPAPLDIETFRLGTVERKTAILLRVAASGEREHLPAVAALLEDPSREVRSLAVKTLMEIGDTTCIPAFRTALGDEWWQVRLYAIKGLFRHGEGAVVPDLLRAIDDRYWQVRHYAAAALAKHADETALEPLAAHLKDADPRVRTELLGALAALMWRDEARARLKKAPDTTFAAAAACAADPDPAVRIAALRLLEAAGDPRAVPAFVGALDDALPDIRIHALWAIDRFRAGDAAPAVEALLADATVKARLEAVRTLVRLKSSESSGALAARLDDPSEDVRVNALWALERFNDPATYPDICESLMDPSPRVREYAAAVVARLRDARFHPILRAIAADRERPLSDRVRALDVLSRVGSADSGPDLRAAMKDPAPSVRRAALDAHFALDRFDRGYLEALAFMENRDADARTRSAAAARLADIAAELSRRMADPDRGVRDSAAGAAAALVHARRLPAILRAMAASPYPDTREAMAVLAAGAPHASVCAALRTLLREPDPGMKTAAALALGAVPDRAAVPLLRAALDSPDARLRAACAWALARAGSSAGVPAALRLMGNDAPDVRLRAAEALAVAAAPGTSDALLRALSDSELDMKAACAWGLARMGEPKGVDVLLKLAEAGVEPVRTSAAAYLADPRIPARLRSAVPSLREGAYRARAGMREAGPRSLKAFRASGAIDIDGRDADRFWRTVEREGGFLVLGDDRVKDSTQTRVAAAYDDTTLYVLFVCDNPPAGGPGRESRDFVTLALNPRNSFDEWYQFVVHPLGDIRYAYVWKFHASGEGAASWQSSWKSAVSVEDSRWIAEMAIPLADVRSAGPHGSPAWDVNFQRETASLPPATWTGRIDNPAQFGVLTFEEKP